MRIASMMFLLVAATYIVGCSGASTPPPAAAPAPATRATVPTATTAPSSQAAPPASATLQATSSVRVEAYDNFFRPEKITITVGTQVTWINVGEKDHTATYGTLFDGDIRNPGDTFSFTFDKPGVYQYYCVPHSESDTVGMVGTITVLPP